MASSVVGVAAIGLTMSRFKVGPRAAVGPVSVGVCSSIVLTFVLQHDIGWLHSILICHYCTSSLKT